MGEDRTGADAGDRLGGPSVTVIVPVLNEEHHLRRCLEALGAQTRPPDEILVIDGGSTDRTVEVAESFRGVRVLENPERLQAAGLNRGINESSGDVIVRVDAHVRLASDYVQRCACLLRRPEVSLVGGGMTPVAEGWRQRGIAAALTSRLGAGPARFHVGGAAGWVDTVYLGAFRRADAVSIGGYHPWLVTNEDAEFAHRMRALGGVWFDPDLRSEYVPRDTYVALARQFFRYGRGRATTARLDHRSVAPRQLAAPALIVGLLSRWRGRVGLLYIVFVVAAATRMSMADVRSRAGFGLALPVMHLSWGGGFLFGLLRPYRPRASTTPSTRTTADEA